MDLATMIGLIAGIGLIGAAIVTGGDPHSYVDVASVLIVLGGTLAATVTANRLGDILRILRLLLLAVRNHIPDRRKLISQLVTLAAKARKEGLLALDEDSQEIEDLFLRKGLELVVDGTEPHVLQSVVDTEIAAMDDRHRHGIGLFRTMAGASPAFGMIGTLIGLIRMLATLDEPDSIGPGLATALLTTLYGTLLANLFFTPVANKLERLNEQEMAYRELCRAGLLALQAGDSPRLLQQKLLSFLQPGARQPVEPGSQAGGTEAVEAEEALASD